MNDKKIKISKTQLLKELKSSLNCYITKKEITHNKFHYEIEVTKTEYIDQGDKMKKNEFEELKEIILSLSKEVKFIAQKLDDHIIEFKQFKSDISKKLDNHIIEFKQFKSDISKKLDNHIIEFKQFKSNISKKLDNHIIEFKEFKSDMLSLPTIVNEFANK